MVLRQPTELRAVAVVLVVLMVLAGAAAHPQAQAVQAAAGLTAAQPAAPVLRVHSVLAATDLVARVGARLLERRAPQERAGAVRVRQP